MRRYMLGHGQSLTEPIAAPKHGWDNKESVYSYEESRERLLPLLSNTIDSFTEDRIYAPDDVHVVEFNLHPKYIAKSYQPKSLLNASGLRLIGSRPCKMQTADNSESPAQLSTSLLVAGKRSSFKELYARIKSRVSVPSKDHLNDIHVIESISPYGPQQKRRAGQENSNWYELVLHLLGDLAPHNYNGFISLASSIGVEVKADLRQVADNLLFLPVHGNYKQIEQLITYTTVRVVRPMPRLRLEPISDVTRTATEHILLPEPDRNTTHQPSVAVFDGGLPSEHPISGWVRTRLADETAQPVDTYVQHGLAVCSALLFGNIDPDGGIQPLKAQITAIRVLDSTTEEEDPLALPRTLSKILSELDTANYDFINLSLGPNLPIEDDEINEWTAAIDSRLADCQTLMTIAVGNNGERDVRSGNARIEIPSDCVNALSVGSATSESTAWRRAPYSALGPGRSPGLVKPDVLAFGGVEGNEFHVLAPTREPSIVKVTGTSFAAPLALRKAIQSYINSGEQITPLTAKTILIHTASQDATSDSTGDGWGRICPNAGNMTTTGDGEARIVYEGHLIPGKFLQAQIPIPTQVESSQSNVEISATISYTCHVNPQSPDTYTTAGLDVRFRPNEQHLNKNKTLPQSRPFFSQSHTTDLYTTELNLRKDQNKWETVLNASRTYRGTSLNHPTFEIHYMAREIGGTTTTADPIEYSLVITVRASQFSDLQQLILQQYSQLIELSPILEITELENN